ncbi:RNA polymerase factor sigma-54 [Caldinitratiruptor microaerophilus]|uniref:RNA polymerase sigma-54 factor n=1 Tax=Caldinitratiruptor microaerophilus TaxID=671077 RepID=A0AA35CPN4_9FIRM|nr:RNA polymerase factor sigma-54 [Caldinitratiruptor microaerophilus]BDG61586.1 RNA polymerase sigma-54 factor [Caldinitratiruptor microaerophilus]
MRLGYELALQQQQKLLMTPELRQALAILQLPVAELEQYVQQQLLENPVLEVREDGDDPVPGPGSPDLVRQWLDYLGQEPEVALPEGTEDEGDGPAGFAAPAPTLYEHLHDQLRLLDLPAPERAAARFLIDSLDENGYLTLDLEEAAAACGQPLPVVLRALRTVQGLDPVGVGARSLEECLLLQWEVVGDGNPLVPLLIRAHLNDLAAGRIGRIAEALGVTPGAVQRAADALRALDPKPGRRFGRPGDTRYIYPDVVVERVGPDFVVLVNEAPSARLVLSPSYRRLLAAGAGVDPETRSFLERKLHSALWLLRSIEQRRMTLLRVTEAIVRLQRPFFERGPRHLQPLTLRQVAAELGVHESTVSRATAGKYVQTPHGLFELKFFFASGVESHDGGISAESVKRLIADLVAAENPLRPMSDQEIARALARQGVRISRRTVAKYREEAGIPSSARRRRYES